MFPLATAEVARWADAGDIYYWRERLRVLQTIAGNPYGAYDSQFGQTTALMAARTNNSPDFNRVGTISPNDVIHLDAILGWYDAQGVRCRFDIVPSSASAEWLHELAGRGYYQSGFRCVLYGKAQASEKLPQNVTVRTVLPEERDALADLYFAGFEIPVIPALAFLRENMQLLVGHPGVHCLFGLVNGVKAGFGILFLHEGIGYLAGGATLPAYRGEGCQKALLLERIAMAGAAGCDIVVGNTKVASISQHNMEKVGLRMAYTKALWTKYES